MASNGQNTNEVKDGTLRYQSIPEERLVDFIPIEEDQADDPRKLKHHKSSESINKKFLHRHPEWEGAPVSVQDVKENLRRCKLMAAFESLDFDPIDNDLEHERDLNRSHYQYFWIYFWKWFLCLMIGVVMGILAFLVDWGIEVLNDVKYGIVYHLISDSGGFWKPFAAYMFMAIAFAFVAGSVVSFVSPLAAGSGIPELKTFLNGVQIRGLLKLSTLVAKLGGVMFSIASGLIAGKEGPFVHGGGIVGGGIGAMGSKTLGIKAPERLGGYFRNNADHRDFVAIGTAAGVAVAFSAPIGGLLFTIEEGASFYSVSVFWRGFLATCVGVGVLGYLAVEKNPKADSIQMLGVNRDFGLYSDLLAYYGGVYHYYLWEIPLFILMGIGGGLLGAAFVKVNMFVTRFRSKYIPVTAGIKRLVEVLFIAAITATALFIVTYVSPCDKLPPKDILDNINVNNVRQQESDKFYQWGGSTNYFPQLWCPEGEYSVFGQLLFVPLATSLRLIFHMGERLPQNQYWDFDALILVAYFGMIYFLMTWTYGAGAPTGLFVPSLTVGACLGRIVGQYMNQWILANNWPVVISVPSYAIIGAAASLGGATRMTLSITVLVMETTGAIQLITPIMITVFFAKIIGDYFGYGIYDTHIRLRGTPLLDEFQLEAHQKMLSDKLKVGDVADSVVIAVAPVSPLRMIVDVLSGCMHGTIVVTPNLKYKVGKPAMAEPQFELAGVIQRGQLIKILKARIGFFVQDDYTVTHERVNSWTLEEIQSQLSKLEDVPMKTHLLEQDKILNSFSERELDLYHVDLRPYMRRYPYVIRDDAPVSRAYRLFRTMGLRQLFVCSVPKVHSVLTRKDLVEDNLMLILGEKAHAGNIQITTQQKQRFLSRQSSLVPVLRFDHYHSQREHEVAHEEVVYKKLGKRQFHLDDDGDTAVGDDHRVGDASGSYSDSASTPLLQNE
eukprot:TRINITY_DN3838_c0_g1_i4.p1 TRINITY_DN3838_c0_g1~~TRINITY_DN3838_c0_g1_i4.p1  ORF type:complete len:949 (-),score=77.27 TRINITY_DN3838_c0_g1_i4:197-3043(-)